MKLGTGDITTELISTAKFVNFSHQFVCVSVVVARKRPRKHVTAATNTHIGREEVLGV
jgi:hypothetical protein